MKKPGESDEDLLSWWERRIEEEPISSSPPLQKDKEIEKEKGGKGKEKPLQQLDIIGDKLVNLLTGSQPRVKKGIKKGIKGAFIKGGESVEKLDRLEERYSKQFASMSGTGKITEIILRHPRIIIIFTILFSILAFIFGAVGMENLEGFPNNGIRLQKNIRGDFEVYLPQNDPTEKTLKEMREDFSTDLIIIYVETYNRYNPLDVTNVTNVDVLNEMSNIEERLNYNKTDGGSQDGIIFILSISTIIKYLNSTPQTISGAIENELLGNLAERFNPLGEWNYSIPNQTRVDALFTKIPPSTLSSVVADANHDGIYDSTLVMIGLSQKADQSAILKNVNSLISPYQVEMGKEGLNKKSFDEWKSRYRTGEVHTIMTPTGPTPMMETISKRTYSEMVKVTPLALLFVWIALYAFHRTWKIIIVTMVPIFTTLLFIFGVLGITRWVLTPQVVLIAPVLIALGVAYGIYIADRYSEESGIQDKGERIRKAVKTTGRAIFLSAVTTAVGFASLMTVNMVPMRVLGFGLSVGILISWAVTMLTVPSLVSALDYKKKVTTKEWKKMGELVVKNRRRVLVGALIILLFSFYILSTSIKVNMDYISMSPPDEPVIIKMREQSDVFNSGQMNLLLIRCAPARDSDGDGRDDILTDSLKDLSVLDRIDALESRINGNGAKEEGIENATAISIVDILKMVEVPDFTNSSVYKEIVGDLRNINETLASTFENVTENLIGKSFWVALHRIPPGLYLPYPAKESLYTFMINVFYNSLGPEFSSMLVKGDYSKSVMYVMMPNMDVVHTQRVVKAVNNAIEETKPGISSTDLSGFGPVLVVINRLLLINSAESTVISYLSVLLLLYIFYKNRKIAIITTIPIIFIIFWQYPTLWFLGVIGRWLNPGNPPFSGDLNLFTAMIGSIMIGIGIDFSIHITERMREKHFQKEGVPYAASTSGMAFVEATVTMLMGLMAIMAVNIPSIREFILLIMVLLIIAAYGAIFILGSAYYIILSRKKKPPVRIDV